MSDTMPPAEVVIDEALVRALLTDQHPDLAGLDLEIVAEGWDNVVLRLGDTLGVRIPRRELAAELIESEQRWLPEFGPSLPIPIPEPVRIGRPGLGYPWGWSVVPWFEGDTFARTPPDDLGTAARRLGEFVAALQRPVDGLPLNPFRGRPLVEFDERIRQRIDALDGATDQHRALAVWDQALDAPQWDGPPMLLHGDLHPLNVIVGGGRITAIIDFGDITGGDPAADYIAPWLFFDQPEREIMIEAMRAAGAVLDDATWQRGRGAALLWCTAIAAHSSDHPMLDRIARDGLDRLVEDR
jgi:aminoglycoside phosphotransferase (APT) family kinase protein